MPRPAISRRCLARRSPARDSGVATRGSEAIPRGSQRPEGPLAAGGLPGRSPRRSTRERRRERNARAWRPEVSATRDRLASMAPATSLEGMTCRTGVERGRRCRADVGRPCCGDLSRAWRPCTDHDDGCTLDEPASKRVARDAVGPWGELEPACRAREADSVARPDGRARRSGPRFCKPVNLSHREDDAGSAREHEREALSGGALFGPLVPIQERDTCRLAPLALGAAVLVPEGPDGALSRA